MSARHRWTVVFGGVLSLMALGTPDPACAFQDEAVLLRLAPAAGSEAVYESVDTLRQTIEPVGYGTIVETSVRRLTVPEASGDLRLLKIFVDSSGREQVDGTLPPEFLEQFGDTKDTASGSGRTVVAHVLGPAYESVRFEDGVELSLDSLWTGRPSLGHPLGTIELPEGPVRVGDSWLASSVPSDPAPPEMAFEEQANTTFRLDSLLVVEGVRHAFISFESEGVMTMSGDDPDMGAVETRAEMAESGHFELDLGSGFMLSHSSLSQSTMTWVIGVRTLTMTMNASSHTTLISNSQ